MKLQLDLCGLFLGLYWVWGVAFWGSRCWIYGLMFRSRRLVRQEFPGLGYKLKIVCQPTPHNCLQPAKLDHKNRQGASTIRIGLWGFLYSCSRKGYQFRRSCKPSLQYILHLILHNGLLHCLYPQTQNPRV